MTHFLNNIWVALSTENPMLINLLLIVFTIIENFLIMYLSLNLLRIKSTHKQKLEYLACVSTITMLSQAFIPSPFNVILNYICLLVLLKIIFKISWLKSTIALVFSSFIFGILNIGLHNICVHAFDLDLKTILMVPIYRISYLALIYLTIFVLAIFIKKFEKFNFEIFDTLDKTTVALIYVNLVAGLITISTQLVIVAYYIERLPMALTLLNVFILIFFFGLSIFNFSRIIKLSIATKNLQSAEEYNHSLEILYDKVRGFKHDFDNIISTFNGYLENDDLEGAKKYFAEVKKDCKTTTDLSVLDPRTINNPGIYSLLNNKYFKATSMNINMSIDFFLNLETVNINFYKFSRLLGILLDNAIEAASQCDNKIIRVSFRRENKNHRDVVLIENTYVDKSVDIDKIFDKGVSGKDDHSGIGLWEVRNYVKRTDNLNLFTSKNDEFFKQQLEIYDDLKKLC